MYWGGKLDNSFADAWKHYLLGAMRITFGLVLDAHCILLFLMVDAFRPVMNSPLVLMFNISFGFIMRLWGHALGISSWKKNLLSFPPQCLLFSFQLLDGIVTARIRSLWEGNVFKSVCLSPRDLRMIGPVQTCSLGDLQISQDVRTFSLGDLPPPSRPLGKRTVGLRLKGLLVNCVVLLYVKSAFLFFLYVYEHGQHFKIAMIYLGLVGLTQKSVISTR